MPFNTIKRGLKHSSYRDLFGAEAQKIEAEQEEYRAQFERQMNELERQQKRHRAMIRIREGAQQYEEAMEAQRIMDELEGK